MDFSEFKEQFRKHHICGADIIGLATTYDSRCPRCEPDSQEWEKECKELFRQGRIVRFSGYWYREQDLVFEDDMIFHKGYLLALKSNQWKLEIYD